MKINTVQQVRDGRLLSNTMELTIKILPFFYVSRCFSKAVSLCKRGFLN